MKPTLCLQSVLVYLPCLQLAKHHSIHNTCIWDNSYLACIKLINNLSSWTKQIVTVSGMYNYLSFSLFSFGWGSLLKLWGQSQQRPNLVKNSPRHARRILNSLLLVENTMKHSLVFEILLWTRVIHIHRLKFRFSLKLWISRLIKARETLLGEFRHSCVDYCFSRAWPSKPRKKHRIGETQNRMVRFCEKNTLQVRFSCKRSVVIIYFNLGSWSQIESVRLTFSNPVVV